MIEEIRKNLWLWILGTALTLFLVVYLACYFAFSAVSHKMHCPMYNLKRMEKMLAKQESRKRKLMDSWESDEGLYTRDEFIERKQMYATAIEKIKQQIREARANAPAPVDYEKQILNLHAMIDCIKDTSSAEAKNHFLKQFIEKITYDVIDFGPRKGGKPVIEVFLK